MSGAGNLFTVINNLDGKISKELGSKLAPKLCVKSEKIEFETEGLMLLEKSDDYHFKCTFFNPDGSTGMMCGNGGRAIVKYALVNDMIENSNELITFEMAGNVYNANFDVDLVDLEMPDIKEEKEIEIKLQSRIVKAYYVDNGSQHTVININKIDLTHISKLDINGMGREVRYNELFGSLGSNANFYDVRDGILYLRTYERGVEKETGACGTGAVATAIAANRNLGMEYPIDIIPTSGEKVTIDKRKSSKGIRYHLIGPAIILSENEIEV